MRTCKFCSTPIGTEHECGSGVCATCQEQVDAARNARVALEERLALLEAKVGFIMNFIQPGFEGPVIGPNKRLIMSLENFFNLCHQRTLESGMSLEQAKAEVVRQITGLI